MKHLLRILFVLALFCGVTRHAHANDFHMGATDPNQCGPGDFSGCSIINANDTVTGFVFDMAACSNHAIDPAPAGSSCIALFNDSGETITSITLTIPDSVLDGLNPVCDTTPTFVGTTCSVVPGGIDTFVFTGIPGNPFGPDDTEDFYLLGIDPTIFDNNATIAVASTPEPDSLLLLSTGVMMAGLYLAKRRNLFAFGTK
jgi:hypothetical protein